MEKKAEQPKAEEKKGGGLPPFLTLDLLTGLDYRPNDIIVSVPCKSGTTWTMNIVHQLRTGGDGNFSDIYWEVPWLELLEYPGQNPKELLSRWEHFPHYIRRAFKAHCSPPWLPLHNHVKYVVVMRNGFDALASMIPFTQSMSDFLGMWGIPFFSPEMCLGMWATENPYSGVTFLKNWWPHRHAPNVFMVHYVDLKANLPDLLKRLAKFLEIEVREDRWAGILEYTGFPWMQKYGKRFEFPDVFKDVPNPPHGRRLKMVNDGGMVRKGVHGDGANVPKELRETFEKFAKSQLTTVQYDWYMNGGELPPLVESEK